jgi:hypothetical protein
LAPAATPLVSRPPSIVPAVVAPTEAQAPGQDYVPSPGAQGETYRVS